MPINTGTLAVAALTSRVILGSSGEVLRRSRITSSSGARIGPNAETASLALPSSVSNSRAMASFASSRASVPSPLSIRVVSALTSPSITCRPPSGSARLSVRSANALVARSVCSRIGITRLRTSSRISPMLSVGARSALADSTA